MFANCRVSTRSGKLEKVREFVRGPGKVREVKDFSEKVREKSENKIFIHLQFFNFNEKIICMQNVSS